MIISETTKQNAIRFDKYCAVFVVGTAGNQTTHTPWHSTYYPVTRLIHMCNCVHKPLFGIGLGALLTVYTLSLDAMKVSVLNPPLGQTLACLPHHSPPTTATAIDHVNGVFQQVGRGNIPTYNNMHTLVSTFNTLSLIYTVNVLSEISIHPFNTLSQHNPVFNKHPLNTPPQLWLENTTGDMYKFDRKGGQWLPYCNTGLHVENFTQNQENDHAATTAAAGAAAATATTTTSTHTHNHTLTPTPPKSQPNHRSPITSSHPHHSPITSSPRRTQHRVLNGHTVAHRDTSSIHPTPSRIRPGQILFHL